MDKEEKTTATIQRFIDKLEAYDDTVEKFVIMRALKSMINNLNK